MQLELPFLKKQKHPYQIEVAVSHTSPDIIVTEKLSLQTHRCLHGTRARVLVLLPAPTTHPYLTTTPFSHPSLLKAESLECYIVLRRLSSVASVHGPHPGANAKTNVARE